MAFDWARLRSMMIAGHGIRRANCKFAIFYQETTNIRKFSLTNTGATVEEYKNFVLSGVALQEGQALPDIAPLRKECRRYGPRERPERLHRLPSRVQSPARGDGKPSSTCLVRLRQRQTGEFQNLGVAGAIAALTMLTTRFAYGSRTGSVLRRH